MGTMKGGIFGEHCRTAHGGAVRQQEDSAKLSPSRNGYMHTSCMVYDRGFLTPSLEYNLTIGRRAEQEVI